MATDFTTSPTPVFTPLIIAAPVSTAVFDNTPSLMSATPHQVTKDATPPGTAWLATIPLELTSKIIIFAYDSDPVSAVCLALTCRSVKALITSGLRKKLSELVPRSCDCTACKKKKAEIMNSVHALDAMRRNIPTFGWGFVRWELMYLIAELRDPNHPMLERERLRSLLKKDGERSDRERGLGLEQPL